MVAFEKLAFGIVFPFADEIIIGVIVAFDSEFFSDFALLYFRRWGIELHFREI